MIPSNYINCMHWCAVLCESPYTSTRHLEQSNPFPTACRHQVVPVPLVVPLACGYRMYTTSPLFFAHEKWRWTLKWRKEEKKGKN